MSPKKNDPRTKQQLLDEINELRTRLAESEESLRAIREGEVDAIIVSGSKGEQVFSLTGSESVYRLIVETMHEAAFTVTFEGRILFCNRQFSNFVGTPLEKIIGRKLHEFVAMENESQITSLLDWSRSGTVTQRMVFRGPESPAVPAHISATLLSQQDGESICIVATDLSELEASTELLRQLRAQQEALQAAELRYRTVADNTYDFEYWIDPEGNYKYVSPSCKRIYGRDPADFMNDATMRTRPVYTEDRPLFDRHLQEETEKIPGEIEYRIVLPDGTLRWIGHVCQPVYDETGRYLGVRGNNRDITERKLAEKRTLELMDAINDEKERLSALISSITDEVWFADTNKQFSLVNPSAIREFNLENNENPDIEEFATNLDVYRPDGSPRPVEESPPLLALQGEVIREQEEIIRTPSTGELRHRQVSSSPVRDFSGAIIGSVSVVRDITDRKRNEEALRLSLDRMRLSQEAARIGVWDWDIANGRLEWDDKTRDIFGISPGTPTSYETWRETIHPYDLAAAEQAVSDATEGKKDYVAEFRIIGGDGAIRWIHSRGKTFFDAANRPVRMSGIAFDITESKSAQEKIKEREATLLGILNAVTESIWLFSTDGIALLGNKIALERFPLPQEKIIGRSVYEFLPEDLATSRLERLREVERTGRPLTFEDRREGILFEHTFYPVFDSDGSVSRVAIFSRDITDRRRAEEALRAQQEALQESEERLRFALETSRIGAWELNLTDRTARRSLEHDRIFGYAEMLPQWTYDMFLDHVLPEYRTLVNDKFDKATSTKRNWNFECRIRRTDGQIRWIWASGRYREDMNMLSGIVQDITDRKQAEEALRESEAKFRLLTDAMPQIVWSAGPDGDMDYYNRQSFAYGGVEPGNITGLKWESVIHPEDLQATNKAWQRSLETGEVYQIEQRLRKHDGEYRWHLTRGLPLRSEDGRITRWIGTATDIHDRKTAEIELANRAQELAAVLAVQTDIVLEYDSSRAVIRANPAFREIYGFEPEGLHVDEIMKGVSCRMPDGSPIVVEEQPTPRALRGEKVSGIQYIVTDAAGIDRHVDVSSAPLVISGQIAGSVTMWHDITKVKRAEEALKDIADKYSTLFNTTSDGLWINDPNGIILEVNDAYCRMTGYSLQELIGMPVEKLEAAETPDEVTAHLARLIKEGGHDRFESKHRRKDGSTLDLDITALYLEREGGRIAIFTRDITERKLAEEELRNAKIELEERVRERTAEVRSALLYNRTLIETSLDAMVTIGRDGKITDVNAATEAVTGYSRDELIGTDFLDYFTEPHRAREVYQKVFQEGSVRDYPLEIQHRAGRTTPVLYNASVYRDETGDIVGVFADARDITEHLLAEKALTAERQRLYDVLETLPVYVILLSKDRQVPFANRFFRERFGESNGQRCYEYLFKRTEPCENCESFKAMESKSYHHWEWTGPDNRNYDIHDYPFIDTDGSLMVLEMGIDVTDVKLAQSALQEVNRTLEQRVEERTAELARSNKELEQFAYVASHDLQEPLRSVGGFVNLLHQRYSGSLDQNADEYIGFVLDGVARMQSLISDLLAYSRVSTKGKELSPADASAALKRALANLQGGIKETGATVSSDALPSVSADPAQLTQIFQNLIGNAIKFRGGQRPKIHVGARRQDRHWLFSVRDNGIGIDPQYRERIFLIFQRLHTREEYSGTGMGLAICKKIVERHGGNIWVESMPGEGSTFFFTIPMADGNG